jgi:hypothetical protein
MRSSWAGVGGSLRSESCAEHGREHTSTCTQANQTRSGNYQPCSNEELYGDLDAILAPLGLRLATACNSDGVLIPMAMVMSASLASLRLPVTDSTGTREVRTPLLRALLALVSPHGRSVIVEVRARHRKRVVKLSSRTSTTGCASCGVSLRPGAPIRACVSLVARLWLGVRACLVVRFSPVAGPGLGFATAVSIGLLASVAPLTLAGISGAAGGGGICRG